VVDLKKNDNMEKTPGTHREDTIFIMGCQRSGTTLVSQLLANHPSIATYHESFFYHIFFNELRYYGNLERPRNLQRLVNDVTDVVVTQSREEGNSGKKFTPGASEVMASIHGKRFEDVITGVLRLYASRSGKRRGGDKTPENYMFLNEIQSGFPDSPIIYLMRDPRDTVLSSSDMFGTSIEKGARMWNKAFERFAGASKPVHLVHYEKLVTHPEEVLGEICEYIGEEYDPDMFSFFEKLPEDFARREKKGLLGKPISSASIGNYRNMPQEDVRKIEAMCAKGMAAMGYEFTFSETERLKVEILQPKEPSILSQLLERLRYYGLNTSRWRHGWPRWRLLIRNRLRYFSGVILLSSMPGNGR
jgi:hypothetical protein